MTREQTKSMPNLDRNWTRRNFVQAGAWGLGTLGLFPGSQNRAQGAVPARARGNNVILFWLSGGPSHLEMWDPKPAAPVEYRGPFGAISTRLPGVQFGELMPEQARIADQLCVLRTVHHGSGDHTKGNHWMLTGFEGPAFNAPDNRQQRRPALGSAAARVRGPNQPGIPAYVGVLHLRGGTDNLFHYAAYLGGQWNPFVVNSDPNQKDYGVRNLTLPGDLTLDRIADRRAVMKDLDRLRRSAEPEMRTLDANQQAAFDLLTGQQARDAFDISREPDTLRDRYGRHEFGQSALLARRLVERGVTFVTVNCVPWDHHGSPGQYNVQDGSKLLIPPLDRAVAALVNDLIDRGLYQRTLVVVMGEFGRTPRINGNAGRDHWGNTFSVVMGCGSMNMGQVVGRSSPRGEHVLDRPLDPQDVAATVYYHLGIDGKTAVFHDHLDRPLPLIDSGEPIRELVDAAGSS
jgi:hypothetical protein